MSKGGREMLFHPALRLLRIFRGDGGGNRAMRFRGFVAIELSDVLLGGSPAHRLFDAAKTVVRSGFPLACTRSSWNS